MRGLLSKILSLLSAAWHCWHIVDTHKLEPRWFQEENDLFTRKCHEEVGRQNVRRL